MSSKLKELLSSEQSTELEKELLTAISGSTLLQQMAVPGRAYELVIAYADQRSRVLAVLCARLSPCRSVLADFIVPSLSTPSTLLFTKVAADLLRIVLTKLTIGTSIFIPPVVCFGTGVFEKGSIYPGPSYWHLPMTLQLAIPKEKLVAIIVAVKMQYGGAPHKMAISLIPFQVGHAIGRPDLSAIGAEKLTVGAMFPMMEEMLDKLSIGGGEDSPLKGMMACTLADLPMFFI